MIVVLYESCSIQQMNIYSFKRIPAGPNKGYYCHPFFKRSDISMARKILRKKQKSELSSSEALIRASHDHHYSSSHIVLSPWLCLSRPQPTKRTTTTLDFSYNSSCDEADDVDFLLGYHDRFSSSTLQQGCPRMIDPSKNKASRGLRPVVLVSLSSESEDSTTSGAGFISYNNGGGMMHGMDDEAAMIHAGIDQASSLCFITAR